MEAKVRTEGEITIISIQGFLDIANAQSFRSRCVQQLAGRKLVFNLERANFVGSTGVQPFLDAVRSLSTNSEHGLKLSNVKVEFKRILQNMEIQNLEIHESEYSAIASFSAPKTSVQLPLLLPDESPQDIINDDLDCDQLSQVIPVDGTDQNAA